MQLLLMGGSHLATERYNTFTVHYIDQETTSLASRVMDINISKATHTAQNLCALDTVNTEYIEDCGPCHCY